MSSSHRKGRCNKCGKWTHLWPLSADKMYCDECFKDYDWIEASDLYEIKKLEEESEALPSDNAAIPNKL